MVPGSGLVSPENYSSPAKMESDGGVPVLDQCNRFVQNSVANAEVKNIFSTSSAVCYEDHKKLELRKQKLSFQPNTDDAYLSRSSCYRSLNQHELSHRADSDTRVTRELQATRPADLVKERHEVVDFEDDLFDGVDLDALEAEAAQTCRVRSQKVLNSNQEVRQKQDFDDDAFDYRAQQYGTVASKPRLLSRLRKDDTFGDCPSFDLGLAD